MTIVGAPPTEVSSGRQTAFKPLRSRYLVAALLVIIGVVAAAGWAGARSSASDSDYFRNAHADVPGVLTVAHPGAFKIFVENGTLTSVQVTDSTGANVPITMNRPPKSMPNYGGFTIKEVARINIPPGSDRPGPVKVAVTGNATAFAVGESGNASELGIDVWGILALLVVNLGAAGAIVIVPIIRGRRAPGVG